MPYLSTHLHHRRPGKDRLYGGRILGYYKYMLLDELAVHLDSEVLLAFWSLINLNVERSASEHAITDGLE